MGDLKWKVNTDEICKQVNRKLFILVLLKRFGVKVEKLISIWKIVLRSRTEYTAPLWHSDLTDSDSRNLERLQKSALGIILGVTYVDFKTLSPKHSLQNTHSKTLTHTHTHVCVCVCV